MYIFIAIALFSEQTLLLQFLISARYILILPILSKTTYKFNEVQLQVIFKTTHVEVLLKCASFDEC